MMKAGDNCCYVAFKAPEEDREKIEQMEEQLLRRRSAYTEVGPTVSELEGIFTVM